MTWTEDAILELLEDWLESEKPPYNQYEFTDAKPYHPSPSTMQKYIGGWKDTIRKLGYSSGHQSKEEIRNKMLELDKEKEGVIGQKEIREAEGISMGSFYSAFSSLPDFRESNDMETYDNRKYAGKSEQRLWEKNRSKARKRDNFKCQKCGKNEENLNEELSVHHQIPKNAFKRNKDAHALSNLICLCRSCHTDEHNA